MSASSSPAADLSQRELTIARIFDAPRELLFKAWTDPKQVDSGGVRRASLTR